MFTRRYVIAEFRRRRGRAVLTALGLGLGVALVIVVGALGRGLDDAQDAVLEPLTGVGTDMSVSRPLRIDGDEPIQLGREGNLTDEEQELLQAENGGGRINFADLGEPGEPFSVDRFQTFELSFPADDGDVVAGLDGVAAVAGELTLNLTHVEGEVPEAGTFGGARGAGGGPGGFAFSALRVTGVDLTRPDLAAVTPDRIVEGAYFSGEGAAEAVVSEAYAGSEALAVGDAISIGGGEYRVAGIASSPIGGGSVDVYVELGALQEASDRVGRINGLRVRAADNGVVAALASSIEDELAGTRVTTASDLAERVEGSLADTRDLAGTLGAALAVIALVSAVGLATLLTLNSVAKRTRELGTLRAIGWSRSRVVGQIAGESIVIGAVGAAAGVLIGVVAARVAETLFPDLEASVASGAVAVTGGPAGRLGLGEAGDASAQAVAIRAPLDIDLLLLGVGLAIAGGVIAGAIAGLRAARLRPSEALRTVE